MIEGQHLYVPALVAVRLGIRSLLLSHVHKCYGALSMIRGGGIINRFVVPVQPVLSYNVTN